MLQVFSGKSCLCDVGIEWNGYDRWGSKLQLHTGDIVLLYNVRYAGTDFEEHIFQGMTAVVANQYTSYTDGEVVVNKDPLQVFVMGIKDVGLSTEDWRVEIVKKYTDVIDGEHWKEFGFNYKDVELKVKQQWATTS